MKAIPKLLHSTLKLPLLQLKVLETLSHLEPAGTGWQGKLSFWRFAFSHQSDSLTAWLPHRKALVTEFIFWMLNKKFQWQAWLQKDLHWFKYVKHLLDAGNCANTWSPLLLKKLEWEVDCEGTIEIMQMTWWNWIGNAVGMLCKRAQERLKMCPGHLQTPYQTHFTTGYAKGNWALYVSSSMSALRNGQQDISAYDQ